MKKNLIFHIGTVKTGSTQLQKSLWTNRALLTDFNCTYFDYFPPELHLPRYANADFLLHPGESTPYADIQNYLHELGTENVIISEEGLWPNLHLLNHKAFADHDKTIVIYVRRPAEVIASWAAENSEPYNAIQTRHASGMGVIPIHTGLMEFKNRYIRIFQNFLNNIDDIVISKFILRPYDTDQLKDNDIVADFLAAIGINSNDFVNHPEYISCGDSNPSKTRKFCDISYAVWDAIANVNKQSSYNLQLVTHIYQNCIYGDNRPVIATLTDETIAELTNELEFTYDELCSRFYDKPHLFSNMLPNVYGTQRPGYQPISKDEVEKFTYRTLLTQHT